MNTKLAIQSVLLVGAMLTALSLSASPDDHSSMQHEQHEDTHHEAMMENKQEMHQQHHDVQNHMDHEASSHHDNNDQHHSKGSMHEGGEGMMMHESVEHGMQGRHDAMEQHVLKNQGGEHHAKSAGTNTKSITLQKLQKMPASGKSREAGYDGRFVMESTSADDSIATRCAQASRGLIMADNATWAKCGGKPEGWSKGIGDNKPISHSEHTSH